MLHSIGLEGNYQETAELNFSCGDIAVAQSSRHLQFATVIWPAELVVYGLNVFVSWAINSNNKQCIECV